MTSRPSRSSNIPIPAAPSVSAARNIESLITIPFSPPPRPRLSSAQATQHRPIAIPDPHRPPGAPHASRRTSASSISVSPTHYTARSVSLASSVPARPIHRPSSTFEPRVIRAGPEPSRPVDQPCIPAAFVSPSSSRRLSVSATRTNSVLNSAAGQPLVLPQPSPLAFPPPSYLNHSALSRMFTTEPATPLFSSRRQEPTPSPASPYGAISPSIDSDDESNSSPPPRDSLSTSMASTSEHRGLLFKLPTRWSDRDRSNLLSVTDGRDLTYHGSSSGEKEAGSIRADHPVPPACGIYYYEIEIMSKDAKGHISIGFAGLGVKFSRLPGMEPNSWGYYGHDGSFICAENPAIPNLPTFGAGDTVGCGIDFTTNRMFFTKNSNLLGSVFENVGKDLSLYPSVGLQHANELVHVNFGQEPFKYDIDYHVQQQRNSAWSRILSTPISPSLLQYSNILPTADPESPISAGQSKAIINRLIMSYFVHHGYAKTARAFQHQRPSLEVEAASEPDQDIDMDRSPSHESRNLDGIEDDIECKTRIVSAVAAGDIDSALADIQKHHPAVLEADNGLMLFKLRCRKFIELILEATEMKKKMKNSAILSGIDFDGVAGGADWMDEDGMHMDIDDDAVQLGLSHPSTNGFGRTPLPVRSGPSESWSPTGSHSYYEEALNAAIAYGQALQVDYKDDERPEVQQMFKHTFGIVAWEDPLEAGGPAAEVAGYEARISLANELNQAILKSQGRPTRPALETLYRHTAACILELGILGVGAAAFADMQKEFLEV